MNQLQLSPVVAGIMRIGQWNFSAPQIARWIGSCLDLGIECFDSADIYGSYTAESQFGAGIRLLSNSQRQQLKIISKCGIQLVSPQRSGHLVKSYNTSAQHIYQSVQQSLMDLGVDRLYALLIHRPDHLSQPEEIAKTIDTLKTQGIIEHFGLSNYSVKALEYMHTLTPVSTHQIEFSPLHLDPLYDESLTSLQHHRITPMLWSPLAGGKSLDPNHADTQRWFKAFEHIAHEQELTPLALTIAWLSRHPSNPVAVLGTQHLDRLQEALRGQQTKLSAETWYQILKCFKNQDVA